MKWTSGRSGACGGRCGVWRWSCASGRPIHSPRSPECRSTVPSARASAGLPEWTSQVRKSQAAGPGPPPWSQRLGPVASEGGLDMPDRTVRVVRVAGRGRVSAWTASVSAFVGSRVGLVPRSYRAERAVRSLVKSVSLPVNGAG